jgi:hypothetical protein
MCSPPGSRRTPSLLCGEFVFEKLRNVVTSEMAEGSYDIEGSFDITDELNDFANEFANDEP